MNIKTTTDPVQNYSFSTEEIEFSHLKNNREFEIHDFLYKDGNPGFPTKVIGEVKTTEGRRISAIWNDVGECIAGGIRVKPFDLIKPTREQIETAKQALKMMSMFIIILAIF